MTSDSGGRNAGTEMTPRGSGGAWHDWGGKELTSPYTKQYTSHIGESWMGDGSLSTRTSANAGTNYQPAVSQACRGAEWTTKSRMFGNQGQAGAGPLHAAKDFFILYDDSEEQLRKRCDELIADGAHWLTSCLLYTSPSPRD